MKQLPSSVRVGPYDFKIISPVQDQNNWGELSYTEHVIRLRGNFPSPQMMVDTVLHELLHACWFTGGLGKKVGEERAVNTLSTQLTQVLRDNPELFMWMRETVK